MVQKENKSEKSSIVHIDEVSRDHQREFQAPRSRSILYDAFNEDYRNGKDDALQNETPTEPRPAAASSQSSSNSREESNTITTSLPLRLKESSSRTAQILTDSTDTCVDSETSDPIGRENSGIKAPKIGTNADAQNSGFSMALPQSWLAKYGKRSTKTTTCEKEDFEAESHLETKHNPIRNSMSKFQVYNLADSPTINWKLDAREAVELRSRHIITNGRSQFMDHPVRYGKSSTVEQMNEADCLR